MKLLQAAVAAVILASSLPGTEAAPARQNAKAPAAPQSAEALYQRCRNEAFRRFGWKDPRYPGRLVLYTDFSVEQTDYCVRNGGHF